MDDESKIKMEILKIDIYKSKLDIVTDDLQFVKNQQWSYLYFTILAMGAIIYVGETSGIKICNIYLYLCLIFVGFLGILTISIHYYTMLRYRELNEKINNIIKKVFIDIKKKEKVTEKVEINEVNNENNKGFNIKKYIYACTRGPIFYLIFMIIILMATLLSLAILESNICYPSIILGWVIILTFFYLFLRPIILKIEPDKVNLED